MNDLPPDLVALACGGGCGDLIRVPKVFAQLIEEGKAQTPRCLKCLGEQRKEQRAVVPMPHPAQNPRVTKFQERTAPGKAPQHTTLTITRVREGTEAQVRYSFELHPCAADAGTPRWKLLAQFTKAMVDRVQQERPGGRVAAPQLRVPPGVARSLATGRGAFTKALDIIKGRGK